MMQRRWIPVVVLMIAVAGGAIRIAKSDVDGPRAKVSSLTGEILLVRREATTLLQHGDELYRGDLLLSGRSWATLRLRGGEEYEVYPHSVNCIERSSPVVDLIERPIARARYLLKYRNPADRKRDATALMAERG